MSIKPRKIIFVSDVRGWVQEQRCKYLNRYLNESYCLEFLTSETFQKRWKYGQLRENQVYFASWRIPFALKKQLFFDEKDYRNFMASVTSHYNIGGGLNPKMALSKGADPESSFSESVSLLNKFKVVSVNSRILFDLLSSRIENLVYLPNGVDTDMFTPAGECLFNPTAIKIGWVGKIKAAKNYALFQELKEYYRGEGVSFLELGVQKKKGFIRKVVASVTGRFSSAQSFSAMPDYYRKLDFYLCTSWHEGTPNPVLEAASCGIPPITTRVGNMPELVNDKKNGFLVGPELMEITRVIDSLREMTKEEYQLMGKQIRADICDSWTWEKRAKAYSAAFSNLVF